MGTKGARLTSFDIVAGTPSGLHADQQPYRSVAANRERGGTRAAARGGQGTGPAQGGFIVRTACEGVSKREIQRDATFLTKLWARSSRPARSARRPRCSIAISTWRCASVRDLFSSEIDKLWCDDPETYSESSQFVQTLHAAVARAGRSCTRRTSRSSIISRSKPQIERALDRKVWLKSGGYLVFDQAEALTAIDVNTGRFVGKSNQDETVLRTNLEAADEVVKQLRLRNIGGIIIVDFIDMTREADRKKVSDALHRRCGATRRAPRR